jgi:uroporphyrinogen decarboxylase
MNALYLQYVKRSLAPQKEIGVTVIWHADGNIMPIVPYLLDAGIDGFQGLQETIETKIDVTQLRSMITRAGKPPIIVGSVSSVTTMPFGSPEDVRADVTRCRNLAHARGGGWLLNFSSSLGPEVPEANIHAFFAAAKEEG